MTRCAGGWVYPSATKGKRPAAARTSPCLTPTRRPSWAILAYTSLAVLQAWNTNLNAGLGDVWSIGQFEDYTGLADVRGFSSTLSFYTDFAMPPFVSNNRHFTRASMASFQISRFLQIAVLSRAFFRQLRDQPTAPPPFDEELVHEVTRGVQGDQVRIRLTRRPRPGDPRAGQAVGDVVRAIGSLRVIMGSGVAGTLLALGYADRLHALFASFGMHFGAVALGLIFSQTQTPRALRAVFPTVNLAEVQNLRGEALIAGRILYSAWYFLVFWAVRGFMRGSSQAKLTRRASARIWGRSK